MSRLFERLGSCARFKVRPMKAALKKQALKVGIFYSDCLNVPIPAKVVA